MGKNPLCHHYGRSRSLGHRVKEATVSFATGRLHIFYDPQQVNATEIRERIAALGYTVELAPTKTLQAQIGGMDCGSCAINWKLR